MEAFWFHGCEDQQLYASIWEPAGKPKAVLQVIHGMTEHMGRYDRLAAELTEQGIAVAGFDLRGHGCNAGDSHTASFGEDGWERSLADIRLFGKLLSERFPGVPRVLLGFSLGSFLLRDDLMDDQSEMAGAILMGTGNQPGLVVSALAALVKREIKKAGFDACTPLVRKLSFGSYNRSFRPNRTPSDWLCADERELDAYLADPLTRREISSGLFYQLLCAMKRTGGGAGRNVPVLLLSGGNDPVGDFGRGVVRVEAAMRAAGRENVRMQLFHGARHDVLHEENTGNAMEARRAIAHWILEIIQK